ncbi:MAG: hypothetical protein K8W52_19010 [Deltaproteobacteria bacterium]|nr:hypothetical protein [Deltaproteobacteria bacterium]
MIPTPRGWTRVWLPDRLVLQPPDGPEVGLIGYRERVWPLEPVPAIVAGLLARHPEFVVASERAEGLVTAEGEYAALVTVEGAIAGRPVRRLIGLVLLEDCYALITAIVHDPAQFEAWYLRVRDLVILDAQRRGVRRRPFVHVPPPGWTSSTRGFITDWRPAGREDVVLTVWPAMPRLEGEDAVGVADAMLAEDVAEGFVLDHRSNPDPLASAHGLNGKCWEVAGRFGAQARVFHDVVVFEDQRYLYPLRLECRDPAQRHDARVALLAVARSAQPIPGPGAARRDTAMFSHWAT